MKYIKCFIILIIMMSLLMGSMWALKVSYDTIPTFHSMLDEVVAYM